MTNVLDLNKNKSLWGPMKGLYPSELQDSPGVCILLLCELNRTTGHSPSFVRCYLGTKFEWISVSAAPHAVTPFWSTVSHGLQSRRVTHPEGCMRNKLAACFWAAFCAFYKYLGGPKKTMLHLISFEVCRVSFGSRLKGRQELRGRLDQNIFSPD